MNFYENSSADLPQARAVDMIFGNMIEKPLDQIGTAELQALATYRRPEGRTLDYKLTFPGTNDRAVKDFLADVTAFANTDGGDMVIGVREDGNGAAAEVVGIPLATLDADILVLRIGASAVAPHRVTYDKSSRFYARNSRGKYEMNTWELRRAFVTSDEASRKIRDLHHRAVDAISGKDMPCRLVDGPAVVLTVAPMSVLREARDIRMPRELAILPARSTGENHMVVGLDGLIVHSPIDQGKKAVRTWSINHRRGYVDFAWSIGRDEGGRKLIWKKYFDEQTVGAARGTVARLRDFGIEGPWVAMATLIGVRGFSVVAGEHNFTDPAWQDPAYLGEIVDETLGPDSLQPFIDGFWRVFGIDPALALGS